MILCAIILIALLISLLVGKINPTFTFTFASALYLFFDFITIQDWLNGYANQSLLTLILLILISSIFEKTTLIDNISNLIIGSTYKTTLLRLGIITSFTSAFLNNTAVVSTFMRSIQNNKSFLPSTLLIPLSYFAIAGGTTTLIGTSTNLIVNSLMIQSQQESLGFFSFLPIGLAIVIVVFICVLLCSPLLPKNQQETMEEKKCLIRCIVSPESKMIGKNIEENNLRNLRFLFLCEIWRDGIQIDLHKCTIQAKDQLYFSGDIQHIEILSHFDGLKIEGEVGCKNLKIAEVVISPNSSLIGKKPKEINFRTKYNAIIIALNRGNKNIQRIGEERIMAGDHLILSVGENFQTQANLKNNFIFVSNTEIKKKLDQKNSLFVVLSFFATIALSALGVFPLFKGLLFLVIAFFVLGYIDRSSLKRHFPYAIFLTIGSSLCISQALIKSGLAPYCANFFLEYLDNYGSYIALASIYFLTLFLTEIMTNNAAASLVFPLAYSIAQSLDVSFTPFAIAVAYGASASFLTPYGYQTNLMVTSIGSYKISDFLKIGWIVSISYSLVVLMLIPCFFNF